MAQTLETIIAINATVGNGFSQIGSTLSALGAQIDGISQRLIDFGKDSLKTYEDYEKNMAAARIPLSRIYGRETQQLNDIMEQLDTQAREWASTTVFHTDDVGNAITEAARAGWDFNQIMTGIPAAMELAVAGGIDLSDALYYITKAAAAGGFAFEDLNELVDLWAFAANSSNGTVESFGDSLLKLGATMRFTDSKEELFSLIALMHDMGESGSTAATLLRTSMMRILAPSGVAGSVMEQLGATKEEIDAIREDSSKKEALGILESYGFSAFDAEGQAKPILQIYSELGQALAEIAGGYDNITKNKTSLGILGTIFGQRGITGALDIVTALEHATELYEQMINGEAAGYGDYASETMMNTLWGSVMTWESKVENLEARTGQALSAQVQPILETVGGIADSIANLDTGTFNALVAGLETIAAAGPGLLLAGGAFRFIGYALTPAGGFGLGLIALAAAANAINELEKADFASQFGNLELDPSQIQSYVTSLSDQFATAYANVDEFTRALNDAATQYETTSSALKSSLITDMLTEAEIKEGSEEYQKLFSMGETMQQAIMDGIENNYGALNESITQSMGGDGAVVDNAVWTQIISVLEQGMEEEIERARALGTRFRNAMLEAFKDGHLNADELAGMQSIMDEMNAAMAEQMDREHALERERILRKAQTLGLDAIREASGLIEAERDAEWETLMDRQAADRYDLEHWYDKAIANNWMIPEYARDANGKFVTDANGNYVLTGGDVAATEEYKNIALSSLAQSQDRERYRWESNFNNFLMGLWTEGITSSDLNGTWGALETLAQSVQNNNGYLTPEASNAYETVASPESTAQTVQYLDEMITALGGNVRMQERADYYEREGDTATAQQYRQLLTMFDIFGSAGFAYPQVGQVYSTGLATTPIAPYVGGNAAGSLRDQGVSVQINGDTTELRAVIDGADGQNLMTYIDGDATNLNAEIHSADGQHITTIVDGDISQVQSALNSLSNQTISVNIRTNTSSLSGVPRALTYAEGGRATEASIFAEEGAEWAIPEEHSERTAELLNAARAASGFTWPELLARNGGLNANANSTPPTLVYSPTIYAQDANGVEDKLAEDKARLEKWYAEKQMRDELEVYA